jgi:hypothetical protein
MTERNACQSCARPSPNAERWLPVVGFEGYLEVSDRGRVRSLDRVVYLENRGRGGPGYRKHTGKILKQARHPRGYRYISISGGGIQRPNAKVHHLVLEAFIGPRPPGMVGCHNNDIPDDNRVENLRWDTPAANVLDRVVSGRSKRTHCQRGHEFTPENTRILKNPAGARKCRACQRAKYKPRARTVPYQKAACR